MVELAVVAKMLVVVAEVPVALMKVKFCKVEEPIERRLASVARPEELRVPAKRLVEKKSVEVAAVVVARVAVKFCNVVEPTTRRSPEELMVDVAVPPIRSWLPASVPEKSEVVVASVVVDLLARKPPVKVDEAVEMKPLKKPNVVVVETPQDCGVQAKAAPESASVPSQRPAPPVIAVQKAERVVPEVPNKVSVPPPTDRLVVLAVVAKRLVVVAELEVELTAVKFCKVEEPVTKRSPPILAKRILGSNQNSAEVVLFDPIATMSSSLFGELINCPRT